MLIKNRKKIIELLYKHKKFIFFVLLVLSLFILIGKISLKLDIFNPNLAKEYILSIGGIYSPLIFISIQILQVLIAPIPGQVTGFAGGYIFGWKLGTIYTMTGLTIGSFIVLFLSRKFGRKFVMLFNSKEAIADFEHILFPPNTTSYYCIQQAKKHGLLTYFLIMLLPAFPDDLVCFVAGLSNIPISKLILATLIGRFPGMLVLSLLGDGISKTQVQKIYIYFVLFWLAVTIYYLFNKEKIETLMKNYIKKINKLF